MSSLLTAKRRSESNGRADPDVGDPLETKKLEDKPILRGYKLDAKKVISTTFLSLIVFIVLDSIFSKPENRLVKPEASALFLHWVQKNPQTGLFWIMVFMSIAVIFMVPIGTPITLGCGYIYKGAYGWRLGVLLATFISMLGSAVGAVICFLLGRYLMRQTVRKWIRKYPLFDAIDVASEHHGLKIMAMLYLCPVLPLGPVSYMCGTTSMQLSHFVLAKVAALPLMMLYVFIGASAGTLVDPKGAKGHGNSDEFDPNQVKSIEENTTLMVSGILLSFVSIAFITKFIRAELTKILDEQKKEDAPETPAPPGGGSVELGVSQQTARHRINKQTM